ncbi:MAG: 50S ribosomal protein L23 [Candidatus Babeliales bacterium]
MALTIYDIIQGPIITEKASDLVNNLNKVVLKVHNKANKPLIKEALEKLFDVKVADVRVMVRKGKTRSFKGKTTVASDQKRAIITLKPGYSLNMTETPGAAATEVVERPEAKN